MNFLGCFALSFLIALSPSALAREEAALSPQNTETAQSAPCAAPDEPSQPFLQLEAHLERVSALLGVPFRGALSTRRPPSSLKIARYDTYSESGMDFTTDAGQALWLDRKKRTEAYLKRVRRDGVESADGMLLKDLPRAGGHYRLEVKQGSAVSKIEADLDKDGELNFSIETQSGNLRGPLAGKVLFDRMMAFFGDRVKVLHGIWVAETNRKLFRAAVKELTKAFEESKKASPDEDELELIYKAAALRTWTGQQAVRHGFSVVTSVDVETEDDKIDEATAQFEKPKTDLKTH